MTWLHRIRLRTFAIIVGLALASIALVSVWTVPAWPVFGVAIAAVAVTVNSLGSRLTKSTCLACGHDLSNAPSGTYGRTCGNCGAINTAEYARVAVLPSVGHEEPVGHEELSGSDEEPAAETDARA